MTRSILILILILGLTPLVSSAQVTVDELRARRAQLAAAHPDGLVLLFARSAEKEMEQPMWVQDPSFQYFTGLVNGPGAILAVDAPAGRSVLFAPPAPRSFGLPVPELDLLDDATVRERTGVDEVSSWSGFMEYLGQRLADGVAAIYLDEPRSTAGPGLPAGLLAVEGFHRLRAQALESAFPGAAFGSAAATIRAMRFVKSAAEIAQLRLNAQYAAEALRRGMRAIRPGIRQRETEGAVVSGCLEAGAEGPSFWPWTMSGPNGGLDALVRSFFDYEGLNRIMESGEVVRVDVGCASGGYGSDVGRTAPVSGTFSARQAEAWDLMIAGYRAGVGAMAAGVTLESVRQASRDAISRFSRATDDLAARMADAHTGVDWHIHGVGIESGESAGDVLMAGSVIAYEPMFVSGPDAFYLEDMILITSDGAEILTTALPYGSDEMAAFLLVR